jgi:hypothetical protein
MDTLDGFDAINDAISDTYDEYRSKNGSSAEPSGSTDPLKMATDLTAYELARDSGNEDAARRSSPDTSVAGDALEFHEDNEMVEAYEEFGVPEVLWDDPTFNAYIVEADGDVAQASEMYVAAQGAEMDAEIQEQQALYDESMAQLVEALTNGEVDVRTVPEELLQAAVAWEDDITARAVAELDQSNAVTEYTEAVDYLSRTGQLVAEEGGDAELYTELVNAGTDPEEAATLALEAGAGGGINLRSQGNGSMDSDAIDWAYRGMMNDMGR